MVGLGDGRGTAGEYGWVSVLAVEDFEGKQEEKEGEEEEEGGGRGSAEDGHSVFR